MSLATKSAINIENIGRLRRVKRDAQKANINEYNNFIFPKSWNFFCLR